MSRINCHSAFQHYEMFHSRGGDVINIGSNNTSIFNVGGYSSFGNFGGGGFWGGFGLGLGNAVGSLFSGLFGGGIANFGFGISPFGMFGGMGNFGFGMNTWGGSGNYGGSSNHVDSSSDGKGKVKDKETDKSAECKDPDRKKLNELGDKVNTLEKNPNATRADAQKLYKELVDAQEASKKDPHHTETDGKDYQNWIDNLKEYAADKGWGDLSKDEPETETKPAAVPEGEKKAAPESETETPTDIAQKLADADDDNDKLLALINDNSLTPEERTKAKAKYAATYGYTNYNGKEVITKDNMKLVTDTGLGNNADITTFVDVKQVEGSHPTEITMQTKYSKTKVTYTFVGIVDGEYIYESQSGKGQQYALQKNSNGYALVEYAYHKGFNEPDVK